MMFFSSLLLLAGHVAAQVAKTSIGVPIPSAQPLPNTLRSQGCWGSQGDWTKQATLSFPSSGSCGSACVKQNNTVSALLGGDCYCGNNYPPQGTSVDLNKCDYPCPGYDLEACGGLGPPPYYSVFNTGVNVVVPYKEAASSTSGSSAPSPTSASISGPTTATQSQPPVSSTPSSDGSSSSSVGITVGVVVAVVIALIVIGVGFIVWRRRQKRQEMEEERSRAAAVDAFVGSGKPSSFTTSPSINDSRLDPVLAHRRMSDGSIADNQDYSRKILRVTNA